MAAISRADVQDVVSRIRWMPNSCLEKVGALLRKMSVARNISLRDGHRNVIELFAGNERLIEGYSRHKAR